MRIESARLIIRQMEPRDLNASLEYRRDPEIVKYISAVQTIEQITQRFDIALKDWQGENGEKLALAIELKGEAKMVGELMFKYTDRENMLGEFGYSLGRNYQGKGIAKEATLLFIDFAFQEFDLNKIMAYCDTRNTPSYALMEKLGMKRESHHIEHIRLGERWRDMYGCALLKRDWQSR